MKLLAFLLCYATDPDTTPASANKIAVYHAQNHVPDWKKGPFNEDINHGKLIREEIAAERVPSGDYQALACLIARCKTQADHRRVRPIIKQALSVLA